VLMLSTLALPRAPPSRLLVSVLVPLAAAPLCLPEQLRKLGFTSSMSIVAILFTCGCVVTLSLQRVDTLSPVDLPSSRWPLAMPIHSLAFCNQFQVLDLSASLPAKQRGHTQLVVHVAMLLSFALYAAVATVCYAMLGVDTLRYPNVLTAFGGDPLVTLGSAAIAGVNFLKLPLVVLPLRHLLVEQLWPAPPSGWRHAALTFGLMFALGCGSAAASDLALAFQVSGSTAGVMVCFVLPGLLYFGSLRLERGAGLASGGWPGSQRLTWVPQTWGEAAGLAMTAVGVASGLVTLYVLLGGR